MDVELSLRTRLKSPNDVLRSEAFYVWSVCGGAATLCYWDHEGDWTKDTETEITSLDAVGCEQVIGFSLTGFQISRLFQIISSHFPLTRIRQAKREAL